MHEMKLRLGLLSASLLVFFSCGQGSIFLGQVDDPAQVDVITIVEGSVLPAGSDIPLLIDRDSVFAGDESTPDSLTIELLDAEDVVLAEQVYDSVDDAEELPPVQLPDVEDGFYKLRTTYRDGDEPVSVETVLFYVSDDTYTIDGLTSYPASSIPEADGLLSVTLAIPDDADPVLVWMINGEVIVEGPLSETTDTIAVLAPAEQGVFPVQVDLYPEIPEGYTTETVPAAASYSAELFVSSDPAPARFDLLPQSNYFALYHLRGTFADDGVRSAWFPGTDFTLQPIGDVMLAADNGAFGYLVDTESELVARGSAWPVRDGAYSPVSISMRLAIDEPGRLIEIQDETGELLDLVADGDGHLLISVHGAQTIRTQVPVMDTADAQTVTISIVPDVGLAEVAVFQDGVFVTSERIPTEWRVPPEDIVAGPEGWSLAPGLTTIGGEGLVALFDEIGVYFRDAENTPAANAALLLERLQAEFGDALVYSEQFTSQGEDDEIVDGTALIADDQLSLPGFDLQDESMVIGLEMEAPEGAVLLVEDSVTSEVLAEIPVQTVERALLTLQLDHSGESLSVQTADDQLGPIALPEAYEGLVVRVRSVGTSRVFLAFARSAASAVPANVFDVSSSENG